MVNLIVSGVLYNEAIFVDLILTILFAVLSGTLWGWLSRSAKL